MFPPAENPEIPMRDASRLYEAAWACSHNRASVPSSTAVGKGYSGARR